MLIDAHMHVTRSGEWPGREQDASLSSLLGEIQASKIDRAVLLPFPPYTSNQYTAEVCQAYPEIFIGFGYFRSFEKKSVKEDVHRFLKWGFQGVKIHPASQQISLLDDRLETVFALCSAHQLCVVIDSFSQNPKIPLEEMAPFQIDRIAKRYPELKIIIAHMGAFRVMDALFVAKSNKNVFMDCSIIFDYFKGSAVFQDAVYAFRHMDQKIVFGSDFPEFSATAYLDILKQAMTGYTDINMEAILSENIQKILDFG